MRRLQREVVTELQQEKKVIYEFIHDLGEAFTEDIDREHLLRIVVTLRAQGHYPQPAAAAIYLWTPEHDMRCARRW